jgi:hypothetical protein
MKLLVQQQPNAVLTILHWIITPFLSLDLDQGMQALVKDADHSFK